jgi:hypothetical protein
MAAHLGLFSENASHREAWERSKLQSGTMPMGCLSSLAQESKLNPTQRLSGYSLTVELPKFDSAGQLGGHGCTREPRLGFSSSEEFVKTSGTSANLCLITEIRISDNQHRIKYAYTPYYHRLR